MDSMDISAPRISVVALSLSQSFPGLNNVSELMWRRATEFADSNGRHLSILSNPLLCQLSKGVIPVEYSNKNREIFRNINFGSFIFCKKYVRVLNPCFAFILTASSVTKDK